jgi:hypothetical protein
MFGNARILSVTSNKDGSAMIVVEAEDGADTTTLVRPARVHADDVGKVWWALCNFDHHQPESVHHREGRMFDKFIKYHDEGRCPACTLTSEEWQAADAAGTLLPCTCLPSFVRS